MPHVAMLLLVLSTAHCILVCHLLYNVPPGVGRVTSGSVWLEVIVSSRAINTCMHTSQLANARKRLQTFPCVRHQTFEV